MKTICYTCKHECYPKVIDTGIGFNDFWGNISNDTSIIIKSHCCDGLCINEDKTLIITISQYKEFIESNIF